MGHRTLTLNLVLQALFLNGDAYDQLRDDDNPFVEGLFLVVIIGAGTALLAFVGQALAWASMPDVLAIKRVALETLQKMPWWGQVAGSAPAYESFLRIWDSLWRILPPLLGAPDPIRGAANIVIWPVIGVVGWLAYGLLAYAFARLLGGVGTLNQTLGTTALAYTPWLFRGLGLVPFFLVGGALGTWQLICRYKALRSVHRLAWGRAFWATVLPLIVATLFWLLVGGVAAAVLALTVRRPL